MSTAIVLWLKYMQPYPAALTALGGVAIGGILYLLVIILLRVPEIHQVIQAIRRKLLHS